MSLQRTLPGTVIAVLFGAYALGKDHPARKMRTFSVALIVVFCGALMLMVSNPDDGPHPRYLSPLLIPLALLAAAGFDPLCQAIAARFGRRIQMIFATCAVVFGLAQLGSFLQDRIPKVWKREGLYQAARDLPQDAIVIVRAQYPSRYARNGAFFTGPLYLSAPPVVFVVSVGVVLPARPIYEAHEGIPWTIERVRGPASTRSRSSCCARHCACSRSSGPASPTTSRRTASSAARCCTVRRCTATSSITSHR